MYLVGLILTEATRMLCRQGMILGLSLARLCYSEQEWKPERDETDCGLVKYNKETNQIYVFEAPDNLLETSPQYTGKMGYICEYDLQNAQ